jgi:nucleotide-binding universal stress UspA family protein
MSSQREPVVVGVDGSAAASHAVRWAARHASRDGLPLRIVHAYHLPPGYPSGVTEEESALDVLRRDGRRWLSEGRDVATMVAPGLEVDTALAAMPATPGLMRESGNASVLVLGKRGHSALADVLLGSTALALTTHAHCPVVLVRDGAVGEVVHDQPVQALRRCARTARLVVVGRRGRGGFRDLVVGATGQQLLRHAACPVAVVRTETPEY